MAALRPGERIELVRLLKKVGLAAAKKGRRSELRRNFRSPITPESTLELNFDPAG